MDKDKIYWQLPVSHDNFSNEDYISNNSKMHCFSKNNSLCGKYNQVSKDYESYDIDNILKEHGESVVCKKCLSKYKEILKTKRLRK